MARREISELHEMGIYRTRKAAANNNPTDYIIIKVCGGYKGFEPSDYNIWCNQR